MSTQTIPCHQGKLQLPGKKILARLPRSEITLSIALFLRLVDDPFSRLSTLRQRLPAASIILIDLWGSRWVVQPPPSWSRAIVTVLPLSKA